MKFQRVEVLGNRYNKLLITGDAASRKGRRYVKCLCDCGTTVELRLESVRTGHVTSCGCAYRRVPKTTCSVCSTPFPAYTDRTTCSLKCRSIESRVDRVCKHCNAPFKVLKSSISGKTNARGNFCSMQCRNVWMCHTARIKGRGSRWHVIRKAALASLPCCAVCAGRTKLEVHHIVPYRLTHDNSDSNLIVLCRTHHHFVECATRDILKHEDDYGRLKAVLTNILRAKELHTRLLLESIFTERRQRAVA